jgi:hypothetical protein
MLSAIELLKTIFELKRASNSSVLSTTELKISLFQIMKNSNPINARIKWNNTLFSWITDVINLFDDTLDQLKRTAIELMRSFMFICWSIKQVQ